jgi:hypothetical protein
MYNHSFTVALAAAVAFAVHGVYTSVNYVRCGGGLRIQMSRGYVPAAKDWNHGAL